MHPAFGSSGGLETLKPTLLVATTANWFPTARLAMAMANAGFRVEAVCPAGHPVSRTEAAQRIHRYHHLRPVASFDGAIAAAKPDIVIPGDDLAARHLHQLYQSKLDHGKAETEVCKLIERSLGAAENFPALFTRAAFLQIAREQGVRGPRTEVIRSSDDLKQWAAEAGFPVVLKSDGTSGGDGVKIVHGREEAERAFRALAAPPLLARALKRTFLDGDSALLWPSLLRRCSVVNAQEFVPGSEATSAIACWRGELLASLHFEVIRKAASTGHATVLRIIESEEMSIAAERMTRRLRLSGLHGLDYMREAETGKAHLIEINPRSTQVGHLALGPGHDLPAALYAAVSGEAVQPAPKVTGHDTIALFPQEWIRDAASPFLRSAYHDVPWEAPELVRSCVLSRRKQSGWYSGKTEPTKPPG
ncbi:MAG: hypothetical protein IANPNBLG_04714 [Bryobacteraceae bacterium]|nr:hypothetical protein [Bryobacteraceae bacterium]